MLLHRHASCEGGEQSTGRLSGFESSRLLAIATSSPRKGFCQTADRAPIGLCAFWLATVLLSATRIGGYLLLLHVLTQLPTHRPKAREIGTCESERITRHRCARAHKVSRNRNGLGAQHYCITHARLSALYLFFSNFLSAQIGYLQAFLLPLSVYLNGLELSSACSKSAFSDSPLGPFDRRLVEIFSPISHTSTLSFISWVLSLTIARFATNQAQ